MNLTRQLDVLDGKPARWLDQLGENLWGGIWLLGPWQLHPLVLLFAVSGTLMISTIRIPKP